MPYPEYADDIAVCQRIHQVYGKSFYYGTKIFPRLEREAVCAIYAFVRVPDEYIDTEHPTALTVTSEQLVNWEECWRVAYERGEYHGTPDEVRVLRAAAYVFHYYDIPYDYATAFLAAMKQDASVARYETFHDLTGYMYGSAAVAGLMVTHILMRQDERFLHEPKYQAEVLESAAALGYAFQLTNFLRDVGEDYFLRNRVYLPRELLLAHDVVEEDIKEKRVTPEYKELLEAGFKKADEYYRIANSGLRRLPWRGRVGVAVALFVYREIHEAIRNNDYDNLSVRATVSRPRKLWLAATAVVSILIKPSI